MNFYVSFVIYDSSQCPVQNGACPTEWGFNWHSGGTLPDLSEGGMDEVSSYISFSSHHKY